MEHLVRHAVTTIRERFWEPLSLEELARDAMVSKYHFLRVFTRVTGVTPDGSCARYGCRRPKSCC